MFMAGFFMPTPGYLYKKYYNTNSLVDIIIPVEIDSQTIVAKVLAYSMYEDSTNSLGIIYTTDRLLEVENTEIGRAIWGSLASGESYTFTLDQADQVVAMTPVVTIQ